MKELILKVITGISIFFGAVFYILFQQKKNDIEKLKQTEIKQNLDNLQKKNETVEKQQKTNVEKQKENENEIEQIITSSGADLVDIANNIMRKPTPGKTNN